MNGDLREKIKAKCSPSSGLNAVMFPTPEQSGHQLKGELKPPMKTHSGGLHTKVPSSYNRVCYPKAVLLPCS